MRTGGAGAWVELDGGGHPGRCARAADRGRSVPLSGHVTILTGGVGGAKLVLGLCHAIPAGSVTAIVNTGDDFQHLGLSVSPDIDTLLYTLSGKANAAQGWGREAERWGFMSAVRSLGGEDWFQLGDGDVALHVLRSHRRQRGDPVRW